MSGNMAGSGLLQHIALDKTDVVFATAKVRSRTAKADVLALLLLETSGKVLGWSSRGCDAQSISK